MSWLHRSKDPVGQPARWIEVIDTYDITFQHRPGRKHGNADALSLYLCRQCGGDCAGITAKEVRAVTRSQRGRTPIPISAPSSYLLSSPNTGNDAPRGRGSRCQQSSKPLPGVASRAMPPSGQAPMSGTRRTPNSL